jgi:membrane-associated phospholipid phosphatase
MPTLVFYTILFHLGNSSNLTDKGRWTVVSLIFVTTCLVPVLTVVMFRVTKVIKDLHMLNRKDRYMPFIFISLFYLVVSFMIKDQEWMTPAMNITFLAITTVVILTNGITFKWKISAHAAGIAGLLGFIVAYKHTFQATNTLFWPLIIAIVLTGIISWARLYLNAHKPTEILGGLLLGFIISYGSIALFL